MFEAAEGGWKLVVCKFPQIQVGSDGARPALSLIASQAYKLNALLDRIWLPGSVELITARIYDL